MGPGPVAGRLRSNLIAVNRRSSIAYPVTGINHNTAQDQDETWKHPDPYVRKLTRKFSLSPIKGAWYDWNPNKQITHLEMWLKLRPRRRTASPQGPNERLMNDDPWITATANKQKNAQLRSVRAVKGFHCFGYQGSHYFLTLEAADAHVVRTYQALVKACTYPHESFELLLFGLVSDNGNGNLSILIDNRTQPSGGCLYDYRRNRIYTLTPCRCQLPYF